MKRGEGRGHVSVSLARIFPCMLGLGDHQLRAQRPTLSSEPKLSWLTEGRLTSVVCRHSVELTCWLCNLAQPPSLCSAGRS